LPDHRPARHRQDAAGAHHGADAGPGVQAHPVHAGPDAVSDITGTDIIEEDPATGRRTWTFVQPGPIFANILLADEINRTPPKTQSRCSKPCRSAPARCAATTTLPAPFFVLATQNPIELEGTYPLPEAQLDRFLFNTVLDYLTRRGTAGGGPDHHHHIAQADPVTNAEEILDFQQLVRMVPIGESVARYAVDLVRASRKSDEARRTS
jgi:MoxR-like ATPase